LGRKSAADKKILVAIVVVVGEQLDANASQPRQAGLYGNVFEGFVSTIAEQFRFQAARDEEIVKYVVIVVGRRDARGDRSA
jgi:hypothetical protein